MKLKDLEAMGLRIELQTKYITTYTKGYEAIFSDVDVENILNNKYETAEAKKLEVEVNYDAIEDCYILVDKDNNIIDEYINAENIEAIIKEYVNNKDSYILEYLD